MTRTITFFTAYPHVYGGGEHVVRLLAGSLVARGWDVDVVVPAEGVTVERLREAGLSVRLVEAPPALLRFGGATSLGGAARALPEYWRRLAAAVRGRDILQTYAQRGALLAGPAARLARVPMVWNVAGFESSGALDVASAALASVTVPVSRAVRDGLPRPARWRRSVVVPNGIDIDPTVRVEPGPEPLVACVARLTPEKGIEMLLRAHAILRQRHPEVRLVLIGPSQHGHETYEASLHALAAELGIASAVTFTGPLVSPSERWRTAWVYVQPSVREGFGLAVVEAMAAGVPVVATRVGGLAEVVEHDRTGLLVRAGDPEALASAVGDLLEDRDRATQLGAAGRERAAALYTIDRMATAYEQVYRMIRERRS